METIQEDNLLQQDGDNYDDDFNSMQIEEVKIECEEYQDECDSTSIPTYEYTESYKVEVKHEIGNLKHESCIDMDTLPNKIIKIENGTYETCDSLLKRIKCEQSIDIEEPSNISIDTKEYIKEEDDFLSVDVKVEEQESESDMGSTKFEVLTEELYIKPDVSVDENSDANSDRASEKQTRKIEQGAVCRKANKGSFICYHCNLTVHSKKNFIHHINVGGCSRTKKAFIVNERLHHLNEYPFIKCLKKKHSEISCIHCYAIFRGKKALDDHIAKKHREFIASVTSKIHECEHCSYKTTMVPHLTSHLTKHSEYGYSVERSSCKHCNATFTSKKNLDDHILKNHIEFIEFVSSKIHQCDQCSYKTTSTTLLARHTTKHSETGSRAKPNPCAHCSAIFRSKEALYNHIVRNHEEFISSVPYKVHECKHCNYKTTISSHLARHLAQHPEFGYTVKSSSCKHCNATFKSKKALDNHIVRNHEEFVASVSTKIHECKYCSYKTAISTHLVSHLTKHPESGVKRSSCRHCNQTFKDTIGLDDHIVKNHKEFIGSVSSKIHQCEHCSYKTTCTILLARHRKKHSETGCTCKQNSCADCNARFKGEKALDEYIVKNHNDFIPPVPSKILQCKHCRLKTTSKTDLARHMTKHFKRRRSTKRNSCAHCNAVFWSKKGLDDHIVRNHEEFIASVSHKVHECKHCSYKTTIPSHLVNHLTKHPESEYSGKRILCRHCNATFKSKKALDNHIVRNHEEFIESVSYKVHQCKYCSYKTTIKYHLDSHLAKHPESGYSAKRNSCTHCDARYKDKITLDDHIVKDHEEFIEYVSSKIHECPHCSYKTTVVTRLFSHLKKEHSVIADNVERIPCRHCDATFKRKTNLDDHIVKNHEEFIASVSSKIHECKHCNYKTTISYNLISHMTKHAALDSTAKSMVKRLPCAHCNAIYGSKRGLDDHIVKKHKEFIASASSKVYECKHCSYKTTISTLLARHMTKHLASLCNVK